MPGKKKKVSKRKITEALADQRKRHEAQERRLGELYSSTSKAKERRTASGVSVTAFTTRGGYEAAFNARQRKYDKDKRESEKRSLYETVRYPAGAEAMKTGRDVETTSARRPSGFTCAIPDCSQCGEQERKKEENETLTKYYTGLRVSVSGVGPCKTGGTVLNLAGSSGLSADHVAICLDSPVSPERADSSLEELTGPGYGVFVRESEVHIRADQSSFSAFRNMPSHIGVMVVEETQTDIVVFQSGQTGRLIAQPNDPGSRVMINWHFPNKNFYDCAEAAGDISQQDIPPGRYTSCYNVPRSMLVLCRLDDKNRVVAVWPNSGEQVDDTPWKRGDFLRILIAEPQRITNGTRNFRISPGTIVRYQGPVNRSKSHVILAGGVDPAILGVPITTSTKGLEKFEEEFIDAGCEVEITATISFRKRDLKGMRAVVILPLDQDGEVGLQFKEDIKAGSLDGHGEDKRCLYIHHSDVKRASG